MKEGIYIPDYVFTCSGVIRSYSMTIFPHIAVENELWEQTLVTTIDILGSRDSSPRGQIQVQMDHSEEDGHIHQTGLHIVNSSTTEEIFVQPGDYVRITTPSSSYDSDEGQFINRHIPVAMVPSTEHNITHHFACSDAILTTVLSCSRMEVLSLQAAISFTVDVDTQPTASETRSPPTVTSASSPPTLAMHDAILISVIVILIVLVVALGAMLTLLALKQRLKQICLSRRKGQAKVHETEAVSALASEFTGSRTCD